MNGVTAGNNDFYLNFNFEISIRLCVDDSQKKYN